MILEFEPPTEKPVILDLVEPPTGKAYRECYALGWILSGPILLPGSKMYSASIARQSDERDMRFFLEITPAKAIERALEAARQETRAA